MKTRIYIEYVGDAGSSKGFPFEVRSESVEFDTWLADFKHKKDAQEFVKIMRKAINGKSIISSKLVGLVK